MPSTSKKQQRFMGAELGRKRAGKKTQTGMSEQQLREFAGSVTQGSLEDITFMEDAISCGDTYDSGGKGSHRIHAGYGKSKGDSAGLESAGAIQFGGLDWPEDGDEPKGANRSSNRDNGWGIHYGATIDYFGPDTMYRAEEIDPHQYGRDWEPIPFRDYYKTEDNQFDRGFRLREQDEYDQTRTPGTVTDKQPMSEAHGAVNWDGAGPDREIPDYRSFENQRRFARSSKDKGQEYAVDIMGHDSKSGKNIR